MTAGLVLSLGCSTTTAVQRPPSPDQIAEINRAAAAAAGQLEVEHAPAEPLPPGSDAPPAQTTRVQRGRLAAADRLQMTFVPASGPPLLLPTSSVRSVSVVSRSRGVAEGIVVGVAAAIAAGLIVYVAVPDRDQECELLCTQGERGVLMTFVTGTVTVPLGALVGALAGHRYRFALDESP
jgi:hypothetical protein